MTELLQKAIDQIRQLSPDEQDAIATRLLAELEDEQKNENETEENELLNQLISTEAVLWSPYTTPASIQALSDLLTT